ncbi:MAG: thioredoxin domain-containing protein [Bacteroidetes bacterium]|nr:MAG: thioredoxin domain-containing protein [Bacteroidota bacterium]
MHTNRLINASSPYLQQHAHNPVDWYEWGEEAWQKAKAEDKLVLVSIGYSACHWCHVMERESFENEDTAALMNEYFVCIKVDREERPDVDQVYMDAVQLITGRGGWPLNMFCLPDGRPLHGGTYFPNREWNQLLLQLYDFYRNKKQEALEFAAKLTDGVRNMDALTVAPQIERFTPQDMDALYNLWKPQFDWKEGGNERVPKFPMPNNWQFLLNYGLLANNHEALQFADFTLEKIARGGINDLLGGGFARYSTDGLWLVPHFEKMLYDNGQLVSVYANMLRADGNPFYKQVIDETLNFVSRELTDANGGFYSALDADSEGVEGKFYVWTKAELVDILAADEPLFSAYYNCTEAGNWEHSLNILYTKTSVEAFASEKGIALAAFEALLNRCHTTLMAARDKRVRPGLDDKIICSWNALMLKGYADAYLATRNEQYLQSALANQQFIATNFLQNNRLLRIHKAGKNTINAFMEDYACVIDAYLQLYQCTFDVDLLHTAQALTQTCFDEFYSEENNLFYFTSKLDPPLVARKTDTGDDVISSANSIMADNLYKLAYYFGTTNYKTVAEDMLAKMAQQLKKYPSWYSRWADVALMQAFGLYQIVIIGEEAHQLYQHFTDYLPNAVFAVSINGSENLPLFENRHVQGQTLIYICKNETCSLPVTTVEAAMGLMQ